MDEYLIMTMNTWSPFYVSFLVFQLTIVTHEIGHALGFWHEQSRPDRDDHVTVLWENILEGYEHNFYKRSDIIYHGVKYDIGSQMHYGNQVR